MNKFEKSNKVAPDRSSVLEQAVQLHKEKRLGKDVGTIELAEKAQKDEKIKNKLRDLTLSLDDSKAMGGLRAVWDRMPARTQRVILNPWLRRLYPFAEPFNLMVEAGLLDAKSIDKETSEEIAKGISEDDVKSTKIIVKGADILTAGSMKPFLDAAVKYRESSKTTLGFIRKDVREARNAREDAEEVKKIRNKIHSRNLSQGA